MNFIVLPREIPKIYKRGGGQNKLREVSKNHEKVNVAPVYFEPETNKIKVGKVTEKKKTLLFKN